MQYIPQTRMAGRLDPRHRVWRRLMIKPDRWLFFSTAFVSVAVLATASAFAVQQDDQSLREFSAPTPTELFRLLSLYQPNQESKSPLDSNQMDELEQKGREFLSNLSPEQQELAWQFAQKYLQDNGVDSKASKALMNKFGVPDALQENLAEEFEQIQNSGRQDSSNFRESMRRATQRAIENARRQKRPSNSRPNTDTTPQEKPLNSKGRDAIQPGSNERPDDPTDANRSDLNRPKLGETDSNSSDPNELSPNKPNPSKSDIGNPDANQSDLNSQVPNGVTPDPTNRDPLNADRTDQKRPGNNPENLIPQTNGTLNRPGGMPSNRSPRRNGDRNSFRSPDTDPLRQFDRPGSESESDNPRGARTSQPNGDPFGNGFDWEKTLQELVGSGNGLSNGEGSNITGLPGGSPNGQIKIDKKMLEAFKKLTSKGSSTFNKDLLNRFGETLSGAKTKSTGQKERLTARFDRLLVDAAKRSLDSKSGIGSDFELPGSVGSVFDKFIDGIHESVTKENDSGSGWFESTQGNQNKRPNNRSRPPRPDVTERDRSTSEDPSTPAPLLGDRNDVFKTPSSSQNGNVNPLDSFKELPNIDVKYVFSFVAVIGLVVLLAYLVMRNLAVEPPTAVKARKFGKRFRNAKIHSPGDLVDAVDHFLLSKFGSDSRWWHAKHAKNILCADAPEYSAKISDLIKDYVRARYTRSEVALSESEQQRYKTTLQELSKLVARPVSATSTGTKG